MQEALTIRFTKHPNGLKLSYRLGSRKLADYVSRETFGSFIAQVKLGYINIDFQRRIDGTILSYSKKGG